MYLYIKPLLDKILATILLILFFPIMIVTAIALRFTIGKGVVFTQMRPTKDSKIFKIYKFRTMSNELDSDGNLLSDEKRLKNFGKIVRSFSLDELPQLINILKGDISFIGPRPLLVEYLPLYSEYQNRRHSVKSGITGLAQINGRNNLNWRHRFRYDIFYAKKSSFKLDLYIIYLTIGKVIKRADISQDGKVTVEKFSGNL